MTVENNRVFSVLVDKECRELGMNVEEYAKKKCGAGFGTQPDALVKCDPEMVCFGSRSEGAKREEEEDHLGSKRLG
jgi:hypothetical protein